ncbi:aromatic ring-hydroxylating dioxygenase subunit alpha [Lutimaribacter sp. EGI FJ00015]|uniref:Aromatic ring-hydroxylating dioxygenase subunit alpha n=1 Tax=Lutimaribacter degradans TaxID=2945989 RepID=A0ACC5ZX90_9RHOB|nr:aromatic ring-hydroxylating dioxygenase subunit alpha [Lutimaribacter sp. EGI FJ00013]MCM2562386.1 aromatic ring-hydroxylating dioxygenase subunit alpha [Lutimaribacter sp. EGI FJ00013]MCO0613543.1 aromatic ring-hydroxylating dioxygenase subunit alpha [Lutimaribacter sp. EGI FJ00015]MCO0636515.1 aromatic ring-hydroxylating dioxygenase subunit alpha [Lutimaribacter sp. EGI FJ00014]
MTLTQLETVRRPVDQANGLPNAHYVDMAVFDEEKHALLFSQWAGLAVAADVPEPGDAVPIDFLGMPLLLLRDKSGAVRVFQNTCRHRGMILVEEPRKIEGAIRCPYHSWCYATDGRLVSTPHVGGPGRNTHDAVNRSELGLVEIRCHVWFDVVWINVSGDAPEFNDAMADVLARWHEFDKPMYHGGTNSKFQLEVASNWKLAVENYCESYHLPWVHPGLNSYSRLEDHYNIEKPGEYSGQGTLVYRQLRNEHGQTFPDSAGLSDKWDTAAEYLAIYPNVLLGVHRDHAFAIVLLPQGPERTVENVHLYYTQPDTDEGMRARNTQLWKTVFEEDIFVVEGMQRGRHAPLFDGGRFSPAMDGPTHCFHDWVAAKINIHRATTGRAAQ